MGGENLAMRGSTGSLGSGKSLWKKGMEGWWNEKSIFPTGCYKKLTSWCYNSQGGDVGHFTQMAWAETSHIGCGMIEFKDGKWNKAHMVCEYWKAGNMMGDPVC